MKNPYVCKFGNCVAKATECLISGTPVCQFHGIWARKIMEEFTDRRVTLKKNVENSYVGW